MTQIRRRFTGTQALQVESRPDPGGVWKPVPHLVALGYDSPFKPEWEMRHVIGYGGRPGGPVLPFQPLSVRHFSPGGSAEGGGGADYRLDNALTLVPSGTPLRLPARVHALDYEVRLGFVLCKSLRNATAQEASEAISAFLLLCEFEALSGAEPDGGAELPAVSTSAAQIAVPARELLDSWPQLLAAASVNGEVVGQGRAADSTANLGELLAEASINEKLLSGELFSIDALAAANGGEALQPGDHLIIAAPRLGRIEHRIG